MKANPNAPPPPKAMTKAAMEAEAKARDTLRKEFLAMQEAVKNTEIAKELCLPPVKCMSWPSPLALLSLRDALFLMVTLAYGCY